MWKKWFFFSLESRKKLSRCNATYNPFFTTHRVLLLLLRLHTWCILFYRKIEEAKCLSRGFFYVWDVKMKKERNIFYNHDYFIWTSPQSQRELFFYEKPPYKYINNIQFTLKYVCGPFHLNWCIYKSIVEEEENFWNLIFCLKFI